MALALINKSLVIVSKAGATAEVYYATGPDTGSAGTKPGDNLAGAGFADEVRDR